MSIMSVYVYAKSKRALNDALKVGASPVARVYVLNDVYFKELRNCRAGTVVKIYEKTVSGTPYAKAYGNVAVKKDGTFYVK